MLTRIKHTSIILSALCLLAAGCTAELGEAYDTNDASTSSKGMMALALINGTQDEIALLNYQDGCLIDNGARLRERVDNPRHVAIRNDGKEALVAYGAVDKVSGVLVVELDPSNAGARVAQNIVFGDQSLPEGVTYSDADHAVIVGGMSALDKIVTISRQSNGQFELGETHDVVGDFVLGATRSGTTPVILRGRLGQGEPVELAGLSFQNNGYSMQGESILIDGALNMASHPTLPVTYVPGKNPNEERGNLEPTGHLHIARSEGGSLRREETFTIPAQGSKIDVASDGKTMVLDAARGQLTSGGYPEVIGYVLQTVTLDAAGLPIDANIISDTLTMLLFNDLKIAPDGNIVLSKELFDHQAEEALSHPVSILKNTNGAWSEHCDDLHLGGQVKLGFASNE